MSDGQTKDHVDQSEEDADHNVSEAVHRDEQIETDLFEEIDCDSHVNVDLADLLGNVHSHRHPKKSMTKLTHLPLGNDSVFSDL